MHRPHLVTLAFPVLAALTVWAAPHAAHACHTVKVCVWWDPTAEDSDPNTQDYLNAGEGPSPDGMGLFPARGMRVMVVPPPPEPPLGAYLDPADGCISFKTQATFGLKMVVYTEALMGTGDNVYVRAFASEDYATVDPGVPDVAAEYAFTVDLQGVNAYSVTGDEVHVMLPSHPLVDALAYATEVIYRTDAHEIQFTGPQNITIAYSGIEGLTDAPGHELGLVRVRNTYSGRRFVFGHEIGHVLQSRWAGPLVGLGNNGPYHFPSIVDACRFYPEDDKEHNFAGPHHGLLSSEVSRPALTEGFAHFIAAVAFNDPAQAEGSFTYYKNIGDLSWPTLSAAENAVSLGDDSVGVVDAWIETQCGPPADPNDWEWPYEMEIPEAFKEFDEEHISSEVDWLRVFWRFVADDSGTYGTEQATVKDAFNVIVTATGNSYLPDTFTALSAAASSKLTPALATRFDDISADLGVYNDGS